MSTKPGERCTYVSPACTHRFHEDCDLVCPYCAKPCSCTCHQCSHVVSTAGNPESRCDQCGLVPEAFRKKAPPADTTEADFLNQVRFDVYRNGMGTYVSVKATHLPTGKTYTVAGTVMGELRAKDHAVSQLRTLVMLDGEAPSHITEDHG